MEYEDPLDIGDIEIDDGIYARAGRLAVDALMYEQKDKIDRPAAIDMGLFVCWSCMFRKSIFAPPV